MQNLEPFSIPTESESAFSGDPQGAALEDMPSTLNAEGLTS